MAIRYQDEHHVWRDDPRGKDRSADLAGVYFRLCSRCLSSKHQVNERKEIRCNVQADDIDWHRRINKVPKDRWSFSTILLMYFVLCFFFVDKWKTGSHRRRLDWAPKQERIRVFNVQCSFRTRRILTPAEQRSATRCVASRRQDKHHLHWGNFRGTGAPASFFLSVFLCILPLSLSISL